MILIHSIVPAGGCQRIVATVIWNQLENCILEILIFTFVEMFTMDKLLKIYIISYIKGILDYKPYGTQQ